MGPRHLPELLEQRVAASGDAVALRSKKSGRWSAESWREWHDASRALSVALIAAGLEKGDRVLLLSSTREEWCLIDFGILGAGAVTVPVYPAATAEQIGVILENSGARRAFVETAAQLAELGRSGAALGTLEDVVVIDPSAPLDPIPREGAPPIPVRRWLEALREAGAAAAATEASAQLDRRRASLCPDDLATIVYTSGTTGVPRGAMLTHGALLAEVEALLEAIPVGPEDEQLLFLPLAHILARVVMFACVAGGARTAFADGMHRVIESFREVRPTFFASVPRLFEKVFSVATENAGAEGAVKERLWRWAVGIGLSTSRVLQRGDSPSGLLAARQRYADKIALSKVRDRFGGRLRFAVSGGAPLSKELAEWFHAMGILVLEGYGLTEMCGCTHVNRREHYRFGSVGTPLRGVQTRIEKDGEILLRGPGLMRGFFGQPEASAEVIDAEGWLHTGDVGRVDGDGFLTIVDRKKDLLVTAGGSNVAPQNLERLLSRSPWLSQAVVLGDRERYLVALVTLDMATVKPWAVDHRRGTDPGGLSRDPELRALIQLDIDDVNRRLSRFEQIRRFTILPRELCVAEGELTETLKPRRDRIRERYASVIREMYDVSAVNHPKP
ncbi:MAG: long-chain fatty acid--CoA ligase [Polyangiaceae bacterium]|nr:long-chain fatty acid--CoA ligase [Polyangiaceae bacterium]